MQKTPSCREEGRRASPKVRTNQEAKRPARGCESRGARCPGGICAGSTRPEGTDAAACASVTGSDV